MKLRNIESAKENERRREIILSQAGETKKTAL